MGEETKPTAEGPAPLWCGRKIPVIGVTGEYGSGKTLFLLSVDPNCWTDDRSQPPTTLVWDTEGSATTYVDGLHFDHRDLASEMLAKFPSGHKPVDLFLHWLTQMRAIQSGRYRVLGIDTVSEIEDGLVDWVNTHPEEFGHTANQYRKMEGLLWGDVKSYWKRLLSEVMARCECLVFTAHMRQVWQGSTPVPGQRRPKGKETLKELASLYLLLDRKPKPGEPKAPAKPSGIVLDKMRLVHFDRERQEMQPVLPPRLAEATPDAIRQYILQPPNYAKLRKGEQAVAEEMSEDERLAIQASIAENQAVAAQAELSRVELMKRAALEQAAAMQRSVASGVTVIEPPAQPILQPVPQTTILATEPEGAQAEYSASTNALCNEGQTKTILGLLKEINPPPEVVQRLLASRGVAKISQLSYQHAEELVVKLKNFALTQSAVQPAALTPIGDDIPF